MAMTACWLPSLTEPLDPGQLAQTYPSRELNVISSSGRSRWVVNFETVRTFIAISSFGDSRQIAAHAPVRCPLSVNLAFRKIEWILEAT
ncbi:MAG TPA: hypothetical protein VFO12_08895 [Sphingomicrobium sp.]|nr:hypothetical protein [Sphingomicrobium sp.]